MKKSFFNKSQSVFLTVIALLTLFVVIVGASFAYFSISVTGNNEASSIVIESANLGSVVFEDGNTISGVSIYPGWSSNKTFTISNSNEDANGEIEYVINLVINDNTLSEYDKINGVDQFVHQITSASSTNNGRLISLVETAVPEGTGTIMLGGTQGMLKGYDSHTYTYKISFLEAGSIQNEAQGRKFSAILQVEIAPNTDMRTWDPTKNNGAGGWKQYE